MEKNRPTITEAFIENKTCRECHWFLTEYHGKTCSEKYASDNNACKDFQIIQIKVDTIKKDPFISGINNEVLELISPMLNRSPLLDIKGNDKDKISEIKLNVLQTKQKLDILWRKAEAHIINNYGSFIASFKDSSQKVSIIKDILESITDMYVEIEYINNECYRIVNNIDEKDIKNDPFIVSINEYIKTLSTKLDRSLFDELRGYYVFSIKMKDREERLLPLHFNTTEEWGILCNLNEQCQAYRDRVLDIQLSTSKIRQEIEKTQRQATAYILNNYTNFMSNLKDSSQRIMIIEDIIEPVTDLYEEIKELNKKCEQTTSNLNSASYSLKEIKEIALKIHDMRNANKFNV